MERRVLGGTGISVSGFALGTMMLGAMGNTDHDESIRMIHTALDAGINFVDTRRRLFPGRVTRLHRTRVRVEGCFPVWDCRLPGFTLEGGMHLHIPILDAQGPKLSLSNAPSLRKADH